MMLVKVSRLRLLKHVNEVYTSHNEDPVSTTTYTTPNKSPQIYSIP